MTLFYRTVQAGAVGTTVDNAENINTVKLNNKAARVLAFIAVIAENGTVTTAEAVSGRFILNSTDLGFSDFIVPAPVLGGGGQPTNMAGNMVTPTVIGVDFPATPNAEIVVDFEITIESTGDVDAQLTVVFDDGNTPQDIINGLWASAPYSLGFPVKIGKSGNDVDIGDATSEDLADTIKIPAKYSEVIGIALEVATDAVQTAAEEFLGYLEASIDIVDISPKDMQIPLPAHSASLGTAADSKAAHPLVYFPLHIKLENSAATFTLTAKLLAVTSGAYQVQATIFAR